MYKRQALNCTLQPYPALQQQPLPQLLLLSLIHIYMQPQIAAVLSTAQGTSIVNENVWNSRFKYIDELKRMGANIQADGHVAVIEGVEHLQGAPVQACDLRAGAAMVIAGLCAEGVPELSQVQFIERGYEDLVGKLRAVGADIRVVDAPDIAEQKEAHIG